MELTTWEKHLASRWAEAFIPAFGGMNSAGSALDDEFWERFERSAPCLLKLGFRAALILATAARLGRDREACLGRWATSRIYLVRQLALVLRIVFSLAHFSRDDVRSRLE